MGESLHNTELLREKARANFETIERENGQEQAEAEKQLAQMEALLAQMTKELGTSQTENQRLRQQVAEQRRTDVPKPPELVSSIKDSRGRLQRSEAELKAELAAKTQALKSFEVNDQANSKQRQSHQKSLYEGEHERQVLQDRYNGFERDLDVGTLDNLKLKCLNFDLELKVSDYSLIVEQTLKRIRILQERSARVLKELEGACGS